MTTMSTPTRMPKTRMPSKLLKFSQFLNEADKAQPDWAGLERWCSEQEDLPDCVPTDVREWQKFREEYESGKVVSFKKSPKECTMDLHSPNVRKFREFGVDLNDFMHRDIKGMLDPFLSKPGMDVLTDEVHDSIRDYMRASTPVDYCHDVAQNYVLEHDRPDMLWCFNGLFDETHEDHEAFIRFLGFTKREYKALKPDGEYSENRFTMAIKMSGKTGPEIKAWLDEFYR